MTEGNNHKKNLEVLHRLLASVVAQESIIGRGTMGLLYQTVRDVGTNDGKSLDTTSDIATALGLLNKNHEGVWFVEVWTPPGSSDPITVDDGHNSIQAIFRECPVRQVCISQGIKQEGAICRMSDGYFAGLLCAVLGTKVDITTIEAGPNACKQTIKWRKEA